MELHVVNNVINANLVVEHLLTFQNLFYQVQSYHQTVASQLEINIEDYRTRTALFGYNYLSVTNEL